MPDFLGNAALCCAALSVAVLTSAEINDTLSTSLARKEESAIAIVDDKIRELKRVIKGKEIVTPTGKFNIYNTVNDVYQDVW